MKVPNCENAFIADEKMDAYLLNPDHPDGGSKARYFQMVGFERETLFNVLMLHIVHNDYVLCEENPYGTKYVVEGMIMSPSGSYVLLRSVWMVLLDQDRPILITAYPITK